MVTVLARLLMMVTVMRMQVRGGGTPAGQRRCRVTTAGTTTATASDDIGVVSGVYHMDGELGQRTEGLTALDTPKYTPSSPLTATG